MFTRPQMAAMTHSLSATTTPPRVITYWMGCTGNRRTSSPYCRRLRAMAWRNAALTGHGTAQCSDWSRGSAVLDDDVLKYFSHNQDVTSVSLDAAMKVSPRMAMRRPAAASRGTRPPCHVGRAISAAVSDPYPALTSPLHPAVTGARSRSAPRTRPPRMHDQSLLSMKPPAPPSPSFAWSSLKK